MTLFATLLLLLTPTISQNYSLIWYDTMGADNGDWNKVGDAVLAYDSQTGGCQTNLCAKVVGSASDWAYLWRETDVSQYNALQIKLYIKSASLEQGEYCEISYIYRNSTWESPTNGGEFPSGTDGVYTRDIPASSASFIKVALEVVGGAAGTGNDRCYFDNVYLYGIIITNDPTNNPTLSPTNLPTSVTNQPTFNTQSPSHNPTTTPTKNPSASPTKNPSISPTKNPSVSPTKNPIASISPTQIPSVSPTKIPSISPTKNPSTSPTKNPSLSPTKNPSVSPTKNPSLSPTKNPTVSPSRGDEGESDHWDDPTTPEPSMNVQSDNFMQSLLENTLNLILMGIVILILFFIISCVLLMIYKRKKMKRRDGGIELANTTPTTSNTHMMNGETNPRNIQRVTSISSFKEGTTNNGSVIALQNVHSMSNNHNNNNSINTMITPDIMNMNMNMNMNAVNAVHMNMNVNNELMEGDTESEEEDDNGMYERGNDIVTVGGPQNNNMTNDGLSHHGNVTLGDNGNGKGGNALDSIYDSNEEESDIDNELYVSNVNITTQGI